MIWTLWRRRQKREKEERRRLGFDLNRDILQLTIFRIRKIMSSRRIRIKIIILITSNSHIVCIFQVVFGILMNKKIGGEVIFGTSVIAPSQIFLSHKNVFAMVNHRPFLPGHVLVCFRKLAPKLSDLNQIAIVNLFLSAQEIISKLNLLNNCLYNISIQNGKQSGQTVPHVHLHLCPAAVQGFQMRKEDAQIRSEQDMTAQATRYRICFE